MAQMDTGKPTLTEFMADRCDAYRTAAQLLSESAWPETERATPHDTLTLARWLYGDGES